MRQSRRWSPRRGVRGCRARTCASGGDGHTASSLEESSVARLATIRPDGSPRLVPICFALDGDELYSAVDDKPKSTRHLARLGDIQRDPRVEVLIDHYDDDWSRLAWLRLRGRARVVEHDEHGVQLLCAKYPQYHDRPPAGPFVVVAIEERVSWSSREGGARR